MPDVSHTINLTINDGTWTQNLQSGNVTADFATTGLHSITLTVGTATQQVSTASARAIGLCMARRVGEGTASTSTVFVGKLVGTAVHELIRLKPRDVQIFRLAAVDHGVYANAEGAKVLFQILGE